jgi:Holliday junction resolvase
MKKANKKEIKHPAPAAPPVKKKRNNRTAGHRFECDCAKELREIGFEHIVTSRSESKTRDNHKVDLMNSEEGIHGRLPYNVQCKSTASSLSYDKLYKEIQQVPGVINVILHRVTKRVESHRVHKFNTLGEYAILSKEDFLFMAKMLLVANKEKEDLVKQNNELRTGQQERKLQEELAKVLKQKKEKQGRFY